MKKQQKSWEELTFTSHFIFEQVMRQDAYYRHFLQCVLKRPIPPLVFPPHAEMIIKAKWLAKGIRLDMVALDARGNVYNVELQNRREKPYRLGLRSRYYVSTKDQYMLKEGQRYRRLRKIYSIFLCTFDLYRENLRRYTCLTYCKEKRKLRLPDRLERIFLNIHGTIGNESPDILALFDYMRTGRVQGDFVCAIDAEVQRIKANQEQKETYMSLAFDYMDDLDDSYAEGKNEGYAEGKNEGYAEGKDEGETQRSRDIAQRLLQLDLSLEQIVTATGLTLSEVQQLRQQQS